MASGVQVSDDVLSRYHDMKMKKKTRYMLMVIDGGYVIHKESGAKGEDQTQDYSSFLTSLPPTACCFAVLDLNCPSPGAGANSGAGKESLFVISWCPDNGATKDKMVYAATRHAVHDRMKEGAKLVQANDLTDLEYNDLLKLGSSSATY